MGKIREKFDRNVYPRLEELAAEGRSRKGIASEMGMLYETFAREIKRDKVARLRLERGEAAHEWNLYRQLVDIDEKTPNQLGRLAFALKARFKYIDNPKEAPVEQHTHVNVYVPQALSAGEYIKRIEATVERPSLSDGKETDE